ncbi:MAG: hypothetical protein ACRDQD_23690 [Nocardioidaceae bacterium]
MTGFALRAPWYVRERGNFDLRDARALRPVIQMYDGPDFVDRMLADPRDSVAFTTDDLWSYPVPVAFPAPGTGRQRFATSRLVHTKLRKLYQPSHSRFYAVVVEVFCDLPGLPRAGSHDDVEVGFVVRRQRALLSGGSKPIRQLAQALLLDLMKTEHPGVTAEEPDRDVRDLWWADCAERRRFEEDNADLMAAVTARIEDQAWMVGPDGGEWRAVGTPPAPGRRPDAEEELPMWRIPASAQDCAAARTRSLWFGLVPTYSKDIARPVDKRDRGKPKLDDHAIYEIHCFVRQKPARGHEQCPPKIWWSRGSAPFRLAAPFDPDGTKNHRVSITFPDLRTLAARAGQSQGPGGVQIVTPPRSQFVFNPFNGIPGSGSGSIGVGGGTCTFALELFFIVAFFLFLLFLPIVVFVFQLWWLLALRFCFPRFGIALSALGTFFATGGLLAALPAPDPNNPDAADTAKLDQVFGTQGWKDALDGAADTTGKIFSKAPGLVGDLVAATDPVTAVPPIPPLLETKPEDPLCPADAKP